jgi:hypothetical protein
MAFLLVMIQSIIYLVASLSSIANAIPDFTILEIDNHPCKPENLKKTIRYICNNKGDVICQAGWRNSDSPGFEVDMNPCLEPICDTDGQVRPDFIFFDVILNPIKLCLNRRVEFDWIRSFGFLEILILK